MKHKDVKFKLVEIELIGRKIYKVKIQVNSGAILSWEYIAYYKDLGVIIFDKNIDYNSKAGALEALNMYKEYGLVGGEEEIIDSN